MKVLIGLAIWLVVSVPVGIVVGKLLKHMQPDDDDEPYRFTHHDILML